MTVSHGVFLVQGQRIRVVTDLGEIAIVTKVRRTVRIQHHRLGRGDDLPVDVEATVGINEEAFARDTGEALDVIILRGVAVAVSEAGDVVRLEDEGVAAGWIDEVIRHPVDEEHVAREDVEVQYRLAGLDLVPRQQHRTVGSRLDAVIAARLYEQLVPALGVLPT